jgi:glucokinase
MKSNAPISYAGDSRIVLTLDAGGSSFRFFATRGGKAIAEIPAVPSHADDLDRCLATIVGSFAKVKALCPEPPVAISFAFPGPADYPRGIIDNVGNLPAFSGGVALGPMLEARFGIPVFINNDGDLFAYGEAVAGFLPYANALLERAGSAKRYANLLGVTLGTGFGGGIVRAGELFLGDNAIGGEVWLLRDKYDSGLNIEEGVSIRAIRRVYAGLSGIAFENAPDPKIIDDIARGRHEGNRDAALEAYRRMGELAGDGIAQALTLVDGLVVIGGGLSKGSDLFMPALIAAMNGTFAKHPRNQRRLVQHAFDLEDAGQRRLFCEGKRKEIPVPGTPQKILYDSLVRTGVGLTRLGTSAAITTGAYAFALNALDKAIL